MTVKNFIERANEIHNSRYAYNFLTSGENINVSDFVEVVCPIHGPTKKRVHNHLYKKNGCPKCNRKGHSHLHEKEVFARCRKIHNDKYSYINGTFTGIHDEMKIICPKHGVFFTTPHSHMYLKCGCAECNGGKLKTTKWFIEKAQDIHGEKYSYLNTIYNGYSKKLSINCLKHGEFITDPATHLKGYGCPKCSTSIGHDQIRKILEKNSIEYIEEKTFKDCINPLTGRTLKFDFFLPRDNICIEYDGEQHHTFHPFFHKDENEFKTYQIRDLIKDQYCSMMNIFLIRVSPNFQIKILV